MPTKKCKMNNEEDGCEFHKCDAHGHCMQPGCPHCDLPQNNYPGLLTNKFLREKDRGEHEIE